MAKLNEQDFKKEVTSGDFRSLYLIYGDEKYLVKKYTQALVKKVCGKEPSDFDYSCLNSDSSLEEIFEAADQLPMFNKKKCVCVTDFDIGALSEKDYNELEKFCTDISEQTVLIFSMPTLSTVAKKKTKETKKTSGMNKFVSLVEKAGTVLKLDKVGDIGLEKAIIGWAKKNGSELNRINASKIIAAVGTDMTALHNEIDKLSAYAREREITESDIKKLCVRNNEARIYSLSDLITKNDYNSVYKQLDILFSQNEKPEIILSVLSSAFIDIYRMKAALESGKTVSDVASDFKYGKRDFVLNKAKMNAPGYSSATLQNILEVFLDADNRLKSTRADQRIVIETLIAKLLLVVREGNRI